MKKIELSKNKKNPKYKDLFALVDEEDFEKLNKYNWTAVKSFGIYYAIRMSSAVGCKKRLRIYMHREIINTEIVDHIDGNGLNNTRENLRATTARINRLNSKMNINNKSGYRGVHKGYKKWCAVVYIGGKRIVLGESKDPKECAKIYNNAVQEYYGTTAKLNIID